MTTVKSIPSMSKAELIKEVERLVALVRSQSAAMTELGKLSDMQQARIAALGGRVAMFAKALEIASHCVSPTSVAHPVQKWLAEAATEPRP